MQKKSSTSIPAKPPSPVATPELGAELWERSEAWVTDAGSSGAA